MNQVQLFLLSFLLAIMLFIIMSLLTKCINFHNGSSYKGIRTKEEKKDDDDDFWQLMNNINGA